MASPHHSNTVVATCSFDAEKTSNVTPACRKDDARRDAAYQQQQQCAPDVVRHAALERLSRAFRCTTCDRQFASRKYLSMHAALHKMAAEPPPTLSLLLSAAMLARRDVTGAPARHPSSGPVQSATRRSHKNQTSAITRGRTLTNVLTSVSSV